MKIMSSYFLLILKYILLIQLFSLNSSSTNVILSDYSYPSPEVNSDKIINVAIMGTNDIHGEIFPNSFQSPNNTILTSGGATNIYSYVKAMRKEYGNNFLWFDGGDQFQGTMECMLSEGDIMQKYYNYAGVNAIAIGNHEFDYDVKRLQDHIKKQKFPTLCANLFDKEKQKYIWEEGMWENVKPY